MGHSAPMIQSPREAERLTNVYRLLKASLKPAEMTEFGDRTHQAVLTFLSPDPPSSSQHSARIDAKSAS